MEQQPIRTKTAYLYCSNETKETIGAAKRGGETYDETVWKATSSFNPPESEAAEGDSA
jgi:hypothetical protein